MPETTPHQVFHSVVPTKLVARICEQVNFAYALADGFAIKEFPKAERLNGIGELRRLLVQREMRAVFNSFSADVGGMAELNRRRTGWLTTLSAGERIRLVALTTQTPGKLPPKRAEYVIDYAADNQYHLFEKDRSGSRIFAILAHGAYSPDAASPHWVRVLFPDPTMTRHIADPIDLLEMVDGLIPDVEVIHDDAETPLRGEEEGQEGVEGA